MWLRHQFSPPKKKGLVKAGCFAFPKYKSILRRRRAVQILFLVANTNRRFVQSVASPPTAPAAPELQIEDLYDVCYKSWWQSHLPFRAKICIRHQFVKRTANTNRRFVFATKNKLCTAQHLHKSNICTYSYEHLR